MSNPLYVDSRANVVCQGDVVGHAIFRYLPFLPCVGHAAGFQKNWRGKSRLKITAREFCSTDIVYRLVNPNHYILIEKANPRIE